MGSACYRPTPTSAPLQPPLPRGDLSLAVMIEVAMLPWTSLPEVNPLSGGVARSDGVGLGVYAKQIRAVPTHFPKRCC